METTLQNQAQNSHFMITGIAVAPNGLNSLIKLISSIPEDSEMAYVVLQDHSPEFSDSLAEILSQYTMLPVVSIINKIHFSPNHIYIIPENSTLNVQDGTLKLHHITRLDKADANLDLFFASLGYKFKSAAIGVILSGAGFDGIEGFRGLKELGAVTIAQDPKTAESKEMPANVITAGLVDFVEAPERMGSLFQKIIRSFINAKAYKEDECCENDQQKLIIKIINIILLRTGSDFTHYKQYGVRRSIAHRMVTVNRDNLLDYYLYLKHNSQEQDMIFNELLITVTGFFSDASFYESLTNEVFPQIIHNIVNNNLRIWIAGCSSGQEAYSVAIALHEYLLKANNTGLHLQIFASDLSAQSIIKARKGVYTEQDVQQISQSRLQNYFTKRNDGYYLKDVIRDMCIFTTHNMLKDPPLVKMDLVCCYNVFKFFDAFNQNLALSTFHYALREKGLLLLDTLESPINIQNLFVNFGKRDNSFTRISSTVQNVNKSPFTTHTNVSNRKNTTADSSVLEDGSQEVKHKKNWAENYTESLSSVEELIMSQELKERQKQLSYMADFVEAIIQTIHEPVLLIDKKFIIKSANNAFYKYFKTASNSTVGYNFFEIANSQWNIPGFKTQIINTLQNKTVLENFKLEIEFEGIGKKIMNVSARQLSGSENVGILLIALLDITEIHSAYELFEAKNLELQENKQLLQTFALAATNNILDPLQKIQMLGRRIFDKEISLSQSSMHYMQRIVFSAENMEKLIEDLILYSKISFLTKEYKRTDLNLIIKKNLHNLKNIIKQKKAVVNVAPLPQLEVIPNQIHQLFTNILSNAIQYSKDDVTPEIHIEINLASANEIIDIGGDPVISFAKISVSDNGIGFDKQYEKQIFDPFFRLHNNDQYIGSGLGLTLVKKIVHSHHGYISASSKIHEGTKFDIFIPVKQVHQL